MIQPSEETTTSEEQLQGRTESVSLGGRLWNWQSLVGFAIGFAIILFLLTRVKIDFKATVSTIAGANPWLYLLGFLVYYTGFPIRGLRWRRMLVDATASENTVGKGLSLARLTEIIYISWFANSVVPAKLGDLLRLYLLKRLVGVRLMKGAGTLLAERIIDLAMVLVLVGLAGLITLGSKLPRDVGNSLRLGFVLVALVGLGLLAMRFLDHIIHPLVPQRVRGMYERFHEGALKSFSSLHLILPLTILAWATEAFRLLFVTWSVGLHIAKDPLEEVVMLTFVALAAAGLTTMPATPAGLGFVEGLIVTALLWMGGASGVEVDSNTALAIAILDRSISYLSLIVLGSIVYFWAMRRQRDIGGVHL